MKARLCVVSRGQHLAAEEIVQVRLQLCDAIFCTRVSAVCLFFCFDVLLLCLSGVRSRAI